MNPLIRAEELDKQIEKMILGKNVELGDESSPLLAVASELRLLPDSDFRRRLEADLIDGVTSDEVTSVETSCIPSGDDQPSTAVLASIMPTLTGRGFSIFPPDHA